MTDTILSTAHRDDLNQAALPLDAFDGDEGLERLAGILEALTLVADDGVDLDAIADVTTASLERIEEALIWHQEQRHRGLTLQRHGNRIAAASHPSAAMYIRRLLKLDREARLTPAALETLAIVAYQQPVTRSEIDAVRGVDSSGVLATLHNRGLIEAVGRRPSVGSPIEYGTTLEFLRLFSLNSIDDLPPLGLIDGRDLEAALSAAIASSPDDQPAAD